MSSAQETGMFDIKFADQNEGSPVTVFSSHTAIISGGAKATPTGATMEAIPKIAEGLLMSVGCRGRVVVFFNSDATDIIESEESQWEIPFLIFNEEGKLVGSKTLTQENMTGFTQAGTVDITATVGVPARVAHYDVPRGLIYKLNPNGKARVYIGDDTA